VTALIERDDVPVHRQRADDAVPATRVKSRCVREQHSRLRRISFAPFEVAQIDVADADVAFGGFAAGLSQVKRHRQKRRAL
jgi:hypothetical protein